MSARVSVVVPVHNVAAYLDTCLESLAQQTMEDLEVVIVDDGSTDESPEIAARFAARDPRFRLVSQPNAGLGAARNTGVAHASGEFLAFVDSDDAVTPRAYEALLGALDRTGSDFASGNARRLTSFGTVPVPFLAATFERTRLRTHITRFPGLRVDRTAWNKLFRRSFWDEHRFRFPEGVLYEDIPVTLPAHYVARSVDVLQEPVYLWRLREGDDLSITQRRTETKALRDRVSAVDYVSRFLGERRMALSKSLYDRSAVRHDLRLFLAVLPGAGDEYRALFLELVNDFLDRADSSAIDQPLAIDRLKWQLVRRRALPELLEVLRFEEEDLVERPPLHDGRHWYADYPFREDPRLKIPRGIYRLDEELVPIVRVEKLAWEGGTLRIEGYAYIELVGAPESGSQRVEVVARRRGWRPARVRLETSQVHRPDVTAATAQQLVSLDHSGFAATLDGSELRRGGGWREGSWEIGFVIRAKGLVKRRARIEPAPLHPVPAAELLLDDGTQVRAALGRTGDLRVRVEGRRPLVRSYSFEEGVLQLEGDVAGVGAEEISLQVSRSAGSTATYPVHVDRSSARATFLARLPAEEVAQDEVSLHLVNGGRRAPLRLPQAAESVLGRSPVITDADWSAAGTLRVTGSFPAGADDHDLLLAALGGSEAYEVLLDVESETGLFSVELTPAALPSMAGDRPLPEGVWELLVRPRGGAREEATRPLVAAGLLGTLPLPAVVGLKRFNLGVSEEGAPILAAERDLRDGERGGVEQRRLRTSFYPARRAAGLYDAVLYDCFGGREYSDSPRAIHEELVRRGARVEHLWVVRDAAFAVPETAVPVRELSQEYYEAYASARFVVSNDHWPRWVERRPDQTSLQTWHGWPIKRHGRELAERPPAVREYRRVLHQRRENWQYVVSPGPLATAILERAFPVAEVIETGLPRTDLLLRPDRERLAADVRRRLGLGDRRVVLYAPTYRDHLDYALGHKPRALRDQPTYQLDLAYRDGYRLGPLLDLAALSSSLGEDHAVLFRKHPRVVDPVPADAAALICDVSEYPDELELLLVADVLVTDYSSSVFDYAVTGRPIILFAPDLERYRDEIRGLSIDLAAVAPGPLLRTTEDVIEALRDPDAVRAAHAERYEAFVAAHCPLADGASAARVVDRIFSW
jgi:CDP-glycerol glycerophosphotransferase